jgi:glutaredoxin
MREGNKGMRWCSGVIALLLAAASFITAVSAEIYQWKDSNGNIVFGDAPPGGTKFEEKKLPESRVTRPADRNVAPGRNGTVTIDSRSLRDVKVVMYSTSWCPYCKQARSFINVLPGVRLTEHDIESSKIWNQEMLSKSGGSKGVPLIEVEGTIIKGYNPSAISAAVSKAQRR